MRPIVTKGTNSVFGLEGCEKLPAEVYAEQWEDKEVLCVQTVWQLSDDDLETIKKTKKIFVSTVGEAPQPISLDVESFTER